MSNENSITRRTALLGAASTLAAISPLKTRASTYPDGPITVIVPLPPGSVLDVIGRLASERFRKDLNSPFVIVNVPGAISNIGAARVAHAKPDGRTVLLTVSSPISVNEFLYKNMTFHPETDFEPVILTSLSPVTLVVHKSFPAKSLSEYIAYARAHPGEVAYGSSGVGSTGHLCAAFLTSLTGIKLTHIPYKGTPETTMDVIAGHIPSAFTSFGLVAEQAKAGNVRILAITNDERIPAAPDVPTIHETVPEFAHAPSAWQAMFVPSHTPEQMIATLNREMNVALQDRRSLEELRKNFLTPLGGSPQVLADRVRSERDITRDLIRKIGIASQ